MNIKEFKADLHNNTCPFCKKGLKFYEDFDLLGYEYRCYDCNFIVDETGLHLEEL